MATVNGYTKEHMDAILAEVIDSVAINGAGNLIANLHDGSVVDLGHVVGAQGPQGIQGIQGPAGVSPSFAGYEEPYTDLGNVAGAINLDLDLFNNFRINPTAAVTLTFLHLPAAGIMQSFTLLVANSSFAITWPAGTKFAGGAAPVLNGETWIVGVARSTGLTVALAWDSVA